MSELMGVNAQPAPTPSDAASAHDLVIADVGQRKAHGLREYGTPLQAGNGRDHLRDFYEEQLDGVAYLRAHLDERDRAAAKARADMTIAAPTVTLVGSTALNPGIVQSDPESSDPKHKGYVMVAANGDRMVLDPDSSNVEPLLEFAGRACYQSFHKPNPGTVKNADYLAHIIGEGHESVLEHGSASFYITGVSRAFTHELTRHRHLSFSQLSQRFVNERGSAVVVPPALRGDDTALQILAEAQAAAQDAYNRLVGHLNYERGLDRKPAREAARAVLPNMTETRIVVTGNFRAWRDVIARRATLAADAEIRDISLQILDILKQVAPAVFADFVIHEENGIRIASKAAATPAV